MLNTIKAARKLDGDDIDKHIIFQAEGHEVNGYLQMVGHDKHLTTINLGARFWDVPAGTEVRVRA